MSACPVCNGGVGLLLPQVLTLILKMEKLRGEVMHANIHSTMDTWMEGIRKVQARRKEEIINATNRHRNGGPRYQEEKGTVRSSY